ncbi:Uncharacterized protein LI90_2347 [Carbonactinospora thermoautotrophica]|uniref:DUF3090 domain-containing protein n=1 Tax=Carbonactinospora thermoautotrophica TaxID=1469144 RepID=A0A132MU10_9ACTN|nr:Uncharacterized protein LI90_2347 [Carbonactinospora thermoautotrophica]
MAVFNYDPPERFVAGTVGQPGQRTFYLQARGGGRITSVALEKEQVAILAQRIEELLDHVVRETGGTTSVPAIAPADLEDNDPLDQPILEEFRVGTLTLAWEPEAERLVIVARALVPGREGSAEGEADEERHAEEEDPDVDVLRVRITGAQGRAFAKRALLVVAAGRPPCPFCSLPIDPEGHLCPRANGRPRSAWARPSEER